MKGRTVTKAAAVTLIAAVLLALMPVQAVLAGVKVMTKTVTLPSDGTDVTVTLKGTKNMVVYEIMTDTTPTETDGLCTPAAEDKCLECDFEIRSMVIAGSEVMAGSGEESHDKHFGREDHISVRPMLAKAFDDARIPVPANKKLVLTLDTDNGNNDVKVKLTFGIGGGGTVKLTVATP